MTVHNSKQLHGVTGRLPLLNKLLYMIPLAAAVVLFGLCLAMEALHIPLTAQVRDQIYSNLGTISFISCILLNTAYGRNYGLGWLRSLIFSFCSFQIVFSWISVWNAELDIWIFGQGAIASFRSAMLLPLLCLVLSRFCRVGVWDLCDYLTPYFFLHHGYATVACWVSGCCGGKTWSWGLLNPLSKMTVFPVQPLVIILSVAVTYWGLHYSKKHNYQANGMVFAGSMCTYGFFRYLIELFTDDARVFWVMSWLAVCSLAMLAFGLLVRYRIRKHMEKP